MEAVMANPRPSGNGTLYFIVGALVAAAVAFGIYYFTEGPGGSNSVEISIGEDGIKVSD